MYSKPPTVTCWFNTVHFEVWAQKQIWHYIMFCSFIAKRRVSTDTENLFTNCWNSYFIRKYSLMQQIPFTPLERPQHQQCETIITFPCSLHANTYHVTTKILQYTHIYIVLNNKIQPYPAQDSITYNLNKCRKSHICYKILPTQLHMEGMQENHV